MIGPYAQFQTDPKLETEGVRKRFDGWWVDLARAGGSNKAYDKALAELRAPYFLPDGSLDIAPEKSRELMAHCYAKTIVTNWGITENGKDIAGEVPGPNGDMLKFTQRNVAQSLIDNPDFFDRVAMFAEAFENYRLKRLKAESKN